MPYKLREDRIANNALKYPYKRPKIKEWERMVSLRQHRAMGLEPADIEDPMSPFICIECSKESHRICNHRYRHETWCSYYGKKVLRYPVEGHKEYAETIY